MKVSGRFNKSFPLVIAVIMFSGPAFADELFWRLIAPPKFHEDIPFHEVVLDENAKILPWTSYDRVINLAMGFIEECPRDDVTGFPWYMQYCDFRYRTMEPDKWPHNPAGLYGMMVETLIRYYPYTGERKWIEIVRQPLDHLIAESTPADYLWPRVPYASADNSGHYRGGSHEGIDGIEPDKIGQAAVGYLRFYKVTGERNYLEEAILCADVLAGKVRAGDAFHSPWPFRVNAREGKVLEQYTSDVLWPIVLFDELSSMGLASRNHVEAREMAWSWLMRYPMQNMRWKGYFEDVIRDHLNINRDQYTAGEVARYLMLHPELDPRWRDHVPLLLSWIKNTLGDTRDKWHGATAIREQRFCMQVAGSHTARYASLCAMWHARGGGEGYREEALRSFALASYLAREDGIVVFSICDQDVWFTDGYFDYVPHFIDGMAALPEMAPADEDHLLYSSSIISDISYSKWKISYKTYDLEGMERLKISFPLKSVLSEGKEMPLCKSDEEFEQCYRFEVNNNVLRINRRSSSQVKIIGVMP